MCVHVNLDGFYSEYPSTQHFAGIPILCPAGTQLTTGTDVIENLISKLIMLKLAKGYKN